MFSMTLTDTILSEAERAAFADDLREHGLDGAIWDIFDCFMKASSKVTQPRVLRVLQDDRIVGAAFVSHCRAYGRSVFGHPLLHVPIDLVGLPSYIWMRVGYGAEVASNPGFVAQGVCRDEVVTAMISHLRSNCYGVMITDRLANAHLHTGCAAFPYVSDGIVDVTCMHDVQDYVGAHRNIKRKIKAFTNKGGRIDVVRGPLDDSLVDTVRRCISATADTSIIRSPFQDTFLDAASETCRCTSEDVVHFIAAMNGEVLGYHSFIRAGTGLRMMHGAFDRTRRTTHHCYENLIIATVDWALKEGLDAVHFGPILNETKRRMMNRSEAAALYFHSDNLLIRGLVPLAFRFSRMQSRQLLAFSESE
jgi:Acetyltransferase (GNAT) domain